MAINRKFLANEIGAFCKEEENKNHVKCVFSSDNDKFSQQTYEANFHEVPTDDIKVVEAKDIPNFDILTAGFPCQPFSYACEKQGLTYCLRYSSRGLTWILFL